MEYPFKVTIGIPVFNVEKYVEKSILSALEQDFVLPYEILVVDDHGTDESMGIVRRLATTHPNGGRIRIIDHGKNRGIGQVRNTIFDQCKGQFLFFLDSDDWMESRALTTLYNRAIETGADITTGSSWYFNDEGIKAEFKVYPNLFINHSSAGVYLLTKEKISTRIEMWAKLWSIDFIRSHNIGCSNLILEELIPEFISLVESSKICLVSDFVYNYYYMRNNSIMTSTQTQRINERSLALARNINVIKDLVSKQYSGIDGIYDLYLSKCRHCYRVLNSSPLDEVQTAEINALIRGSMSIVPSSKHISLLNNRIMWLFLRNDDSLGRYSTYDRVLSFVAHTIAKLKRVFHT